MNTQKYIYRAQAAALAGVSAQTISNWKKRGLLSTITSGKTLLYKKADVEALRAHSTEIQDLEGNIALYKKMLEDEKQALNEKLNGISREIAQAYRFSLTWKTVTVPTIASYIQFMCGNEILELAPRMRSMLIDILNFNNCEDIARKYGLSRERVRQILNKLENVFLKSQSLPDKYLALQKENESLLRRLAEAESMPTSRRIKATDNTPIRDLGLSNRAIGCLVAIDIDTLEDLQKWTIRDLRKIRNLGKKTLDEILDMLESRGIFLQN